MKLPSDPKERTKMLILIGVVAVVVLLVLIQFGIRPMLARKAELRQKIIDLEEKQAANEEDGKKMQKGRRENLLTLTSIMQVAGDKTMIMEPRLGNYLLGASEFVEAHARDLGLTVDVREGGITQLPHLPKSTTELFLKAYTVRVTLNTGLHSLYALVKKLEEANPHLCVSSLNIIPRAETPEKHDVLLEIQLPIWSDPEMGETLKSRLKDAEALKAESRTGGAK